MDTLDNKAPVQANASDLQAEFDAMRNLVMSILILVIVISGTLNIYLLRQWKTVSRELKDIRPQATQLIADYQKTSAPAMSDFLKKVTEYGRTHPDFAPVLAKYGLKPAGVTGAVPAITTPQQPAAPPKK